MKSSVALLAAACTTLVFATPAAAASFDCTNVRKAAEQAICENRRLSRLDEQLDYWYGRARERARYFDQTNWLVSQQRAWLRQRNQCGFDVRCLRWEYRSRIRALRSYATHV